MKKVFILFFVLSMVFLRLTSISSIAACSDVQADQQAVVNAQAELANAQRIAQEAVTTAQANVQAAQQALTNAEAKAKVDEGLCSAPVVNPTLAPNGAAADYNCSNRGEYSLRTCPCNGCPVNGTCRCDNGRSGSCDTGICYF